MFRHRECVGPYGGGHPCIGSSEDVKSISCNTHVCPTDGVWGPWKDLYDSQSCRRASCSAGAVAQARERKCIGPYNGGRPCLGESYIETCVEDHHYRPPSGQYTASPPSGQYVADPPSGQYSTISTKPVYGVPNSAINPRTLGSAPATGEPVKPTYSATLRNPRKITSGKQTQTLHDTFSSAKPVYDGILTPYTGRSTSDNAETKINKPVYGPNTKTMRF